MANKRNYEWPQASTWDGYFTQDKAGGTTQRVDPSLVFARLRAEGFLDYKAVSVVASQGLTDTEKVAARGNIDAAKDLVSLTITPVIVGTTATLTIEQGSFSSIDLTSETALTDVTVVLTNASGVSFPVWWFKIKAGSDITLSVEIGAVAVGWLGSAIDNIALGKTVEVSVVDNVACGGELV